MPAKLKILPNEMYGVWKVLEANVINPDTKDKLYIGRNVFSKCICTNCNETIRYIRNNELKKYSTKKCAKCTRRENASLSWPKIGEKFGLLTVIGDGGIQQSSSGSRHYSLCQCKCGSIVSVQDNKLKTKNTQSCGKCLSSSGEQKIIEILEKNHILYDHDVIFMPFYKETGHRYRFDFILYDIDGEINRFIEFDGRQHFTGPDTNFWSRTTETLQKIQQRDQLKNDWCKSKGYRLSRIPYTQLNNLTLELLYDKQWEV